VVSPICVSVQALKEVAVSSGSACTSATLEPSYVLRALGVAEDMAHTSIRFGIGRFTTAKEIDHTISLIVKYYHPFSHSPHLTLLSFLS
jgi:cysteine desulfurase